MKQAPPPHGSSATGSILMLASAFNFAILDSLVKILGPSFRVWDIAFYRFGCGMLLLTALFCWYGNPFKGHNQKLMVINGLISAMGFLALVTSIRLIPISTAMVLFYSFPAFAALFSSVIFKEKIKIIELLYIFVTFLGVMLLFEFHWRGSLFGQAMGLLAGIFIGLSITVVRKLREQDGPVVIYLYYCLVGIATSFPLFIVDPRLPQIGTEWLILGGIVLSSVCAMLLMNMGFRYCKSWEGGLFLSSELVFTSLFGFFFLHELVTWRFLGGGLLILASVIALNISNARKSSPLSLTAGDR
jgi:drug/metabolite transporter (DMT)-like permease